MIRGKYILAIVLGYTLCAFGFAQEGVLIEVNVVQGFGQDSSPGTAIVNAQLRAGANNEVHVLAAKCRDKYSGKMQLSYDIESVRPAPDENGFVSLVNLTYKCFAPESYFTDPEKDIVTELEQAEIRVHQKNLEAVKATLARYYGLAD